MKLGRSLLLLQRPHVRLRSGTRVKGALAAGAALALVLLPGIHLAAGEVELLPDVSVQLAGTYYVPPEDAFVWDTWIGAGAGLLRVNAATAYLAADVETVLGRERRAFDANQANYHLEAGLRIQAGRQLLIPFFHHVSRHVIDRPKTQLVDWNLLGGRVTGPLPKAFDLPGRYAASVAHTVEWRAVGYQWELTAAFAIDLCRCAWGAPYLRAGVRFVTIAPDAHFPRGDFADVVAEAGAHFGKHARELDLFAAFEHRNDVFVLAPGVRDRLLLGLRIGVAPGGSAGPKLPIQWQDGTSQ